jgi:GAF domain-containing protein
VELTDRRLGALVKLSLALSREHDLSGLLQRVTDEVRGLTGAALAVLWESDGESRTVTRRAWTTDGTVDTSEVPWSLAFGEGITGWIAERREPAFVPQVGRDDRIDETATWLGRFGLDEYVGVPVLAGEELLGVLTLYLRSTRPGGANESELLIAFAAQAAVAIRSARLLAASDLKRTETEVLADQVAVAQVEIS